MKTFTKNMKKKNGNCIKKFLYSSMNVIINIRYICNNRSPNRNCFRRCRIPLDMNFRLSTNGSNFSCSSYKVESAN